MIVSPFPRVRPVADTGPAAWIEAGTGTFDSGVNALLPAGLQAYARILHPADSPSGEPVRWAEVARWSGRTLHPLAQFDRLRVPVPGAGAGPRPWDESPLEGALPPAELEVLAGLLPAGERCWFALWDGWGWIGDGSSTAVLRSSTGPLPEPGEAPPSFDPAQLDGPRVHLPGRDFLLFEGPLDAVGEFGDRGQDHFFPQAPNLFWPDGHEWCVATDVDLNSTYVGGTAALIGALLAEPRLEVLPARLDDPISLHGDEVNR